MLDKSPSLMEAWYFLGLAKSGFALIDREQDVRERYLEEALEAYELGKKVCGQPGILADAQAKLSELDKYAPGRLGAVFKILT